MREREIEMEFPEAALELIDRSLQTALEIMFPDLCQDDEFLSLCEESGYKNQEKEFLEEIDSHLKRQILEQGQADEFLIILIENQWKLIYGIILIIHDAINEKLDELCQKFPKEDEDLAAIDNYQLEILILDHILKELQLHLFGAPSDVYLM